MQDSPTDSPTAGAAETAETSPENKGAWWQRLTGGLKRSSTALGAITDLVTKRKLDTATLDEIDDALLRADLGLETSNRIVSALSEGRHNAEITPDEVKAVVATEVEKALAPVAQPLVIDTNEKAVHRSGRRRQRLRQDYDHRQARGKVSRRRPFGDACGRRYVPCRGDRAA